MNLLCIVIARRVQQKSKHLKTTKGVVTDNKNVNAEGIGEIERAGKVCGIGGIDKICNVGETGEAGEIGNMRETGEVESVDEVDEIGKDGGDGGDGKDGGDGEDGEVGKISHVKVNEIGDKIKVKIVIEIEVGKAVGIEVGEIRIVTINTDGSKNARGGKPR